MKLQLPDVTLVCIDTICHELAALAVRDCVDRADFGAVHIHTDKTEAFEIVPTALFFETHVDSMETVANYMWHEMPKYVHTSHALFIHWDSGIVDPSAWSDEFLHNDYIGAPWGWHGDGHDVGNGGFSLRSANLLRFLAKHKDKYPPKQPEDHHLCRTYRADLETDGFFFAPIKLASRFAFERTKVEGVDKHFGYHGIFNWPRVFSDAELIPRVDLVMENDHAKQDKHLGELIRTCSRMVKETEKRSS